MKSIFIIAFGIGLFIAYTGNSQVVSYPFVGKTFSTSTGFGTARMLGMGGSFNVLGADITSISGNPAGLGFYNRNELSISGSLGFSNIGSNYIGNQTSTTENDVNFTGLGLVLAGEENAQGDWKGSFGFAYSKQLMFKQSFSSIGINNASSMLDYFIQQANKKGETGTSLDDQYDSNSNTALSPEAVAYQSYLINPDAKSGGVPFNRFEASLPTRQEGYASMNGYQSQWDISYGASYQQKFYIGGGIHFTRINSTLSNSWRETFVGAKYVDGFTYSENLETSGKGLSVSLGMIYKVNSSIRVALNFQTPTYYEQVNEQLTGGMVTRAISIPSYSNGSPVNITKVSPVSLATNEFTYQLTTPMRIGGGLAYFLGRKGFISLDLEMVDYSNIKVGSQELSYSANQQFKNKYNSIASKYFQTDLNVKFGAEYRVASNFSLRAGIAQFGGGYQKSYDSIDRNIWQFSGGFGYRSNDFYWDIAYLYRTYKDAFTPYSLDNTANYASSQLQITNSQISLTGGVFF